MWAGNNNPRNSYWSSSNPNELVFIGSGNTRASIDLDNGNSYFQGQVRASQFVDADSTGYYMNPQGTSRLNGLYLVSSGNQVSGYDASLNIQGSNNDWAIIIDKSSYDYGIDARMGTNHSYAFRALRNGSQYFRVGTDYMYHQYQMRSPIYYHYNNTGYYMDPDGSSNLGTSIRATDIYARSWLRNDASGTGLYNQATGQHWYSDDDDYWNVAGGGSANGIRFRDQHAGTIRGYVYSTSSNEIGLLDSGGSWAIRHQNDNGTYFYTDNSALEFRVGRDAVTGNYGTVQTSTTRGGWGGYSINGHWTFMHDHSNAAGLFNDIENEWAVYMLRNSYVELMYNGTWELATRSGYGLARGSMRAPVFYDSNDSGYYIDPNSTSTAALRMRGGALFGPNNSWGEYLAVGGNGRYSSSYASVATTNGNLHLDARSGRSMYLNWYTGGTVYVNGAMQADIYYDRNSTSYYGNFASTSYMNDVRVNILYDRENTGYYFGNGQGGTRVSSLDILGRTWFANYLVSRNQGGMMGDYNVSGTRSKVIWTIGESWPIGNMYGLAYEYNGGYGHHLALKNNGSTYHRISFSSQGANFAGTVYAGSSFRSPIFYDTNNTGYYFDGASAHSTRFEGVSNRTMAYIGQPGHTRNSGEYYRARPRQTSDTNYWTGAFGWGRQDMNVVSTWGSGFIDSWSNPGNQPSGTSHWVGMQAFHYRSSNTGGYGWQMVGGPITNLRFRSSWSGWRSWRTIPVLDENSGNGGSMYAGRYYDSNSTGYYVDPASTSNLNSVYANDWFRPRGSTGVYWQDRGMGIRSVRDEGGQYGTVATYGSDVGGYEGWSIGGRVVFMHDMSSANGIYNDVNNEWHMLNYLNDRVRLYYNGAEKIRTESYGAYIIGSLRASSDIIAYYSDMRLKDKEGDIENALDKIGKLNGFYYRNNKEANMIGYEGTELQIGLSAQDVKSILPEIVHPAPLAQSLGYDYMTIQYDRVVPLIVNAVNEQKAIVDSQKEEIEYLKSELLEMKEMMKELLNK